MDNVAQINADADVNLLDRLFVSVVGAELGVHLLEAVEKLPVYQF